MDKDVVVHPHPTQALAPHHVDLRGKNPGVHRVLCQVALQLAKQALALARLRSLSEAQWAASAGRAPAFDDERLDEVVWRYRARNFPATLTDEERARWQAHCAARLIEGQAGAMTLQRFQERIDALAAEREDDEAAMDLLGALVDYGEQIAPEAD